jgi:hypothetical protein
MATCGKTGQEGVMVVDRRGMHRAHKVAPTLARWAGQVRLPFLPAHRGHHLKPLAGCWRVLKSPGGAGRSWSTVRSFYQRTRPVLMAHQLKPISTFHW